MNLKYEWDSIKYKINTTIKKLKMGEYDTSIVLGLGITLIYITIIITLIVIKG